MALKGRKELNARLQAVRQSFKPIGRKWADDYVRLGRPRIPVATGKTRRSLRRRHANMKRATVAASYVTNFIDAGVKPHRITAKTGGSLAFKANGRTVFARSVFHRGHRARPFKKRTADEAMRRTPMAHTLIDEWNRAA